MHEWTLEVVENEMLEAVLLSGSNMQFYTNYNSYV